MSQKTLEKVLEHLLNHEQEAAGDLLHNYFVEKGRSIYESMIQSDEQVEEEIGSDPVADFEEEVIADENEIENEEMFSEEEGDEEMTAVDAEMPAEEPAAEEPAAELDADAVEGAKDAMMDVTDAIAALKAEFDKLVGDESGAEEETSSDVADESLGESVDMQKVATPDNGDKADNTKSPVSSGPEVSANGAEATDFGGGDEKGGATPKSTDAGSTTQPDLKSVKV